VSGGGKVATLNRFGDGKKGSGGRGGGGGEDDRSGAGKRGGDEGVGGGGGHVVDARPLGVSLSGVPYPTVKYPTVKPKMPRAERGPVPGRHYVCMYDVCCMYTYIGAGTVLPTQSARRTEAIPVQSDAPVQIA
jgi:hypothetical protein